MDVSNRAPGQWETLRTPLSLQNGRREIGRIRVGVIIEGTTVNSQLCTHVPEENREYRIVANIDVDGETNEYASNFFARLTYEQFDDLVVSSGEIELNGELYTECVYLSDTSVGDKTYTVFNAKWQSRAGCGLCVVVC